MNLNFPIGSVKEFVLKYVAFYNLLMPLHQQVLPSEAELIAEFASLDDAKFEYQRFGALAKNKVIESYSTQGRKLTKLNINNKLYSLLDRKFLVRDEDKVIYFPKHLSLALSQYKTSSVFNVNIKFNGVKS